MFRLFLRPPWLASHALALSLVVAFVGAGLWQLDRLDERRERNSLVLSRRGMAPVPVAQVAGLDEDRHRTVVAEGRFEAEGTYLIDNRSVGGRPGAWVVSTLRLPDETHLAVVRGFLASAAGPPAPASGRAEVIGRIDGTDRSCATRVDDGGTLAGVACPNPARAGAVQGWDVHPYLVVADSISPPIPDDAVVPVPPPELGEGPHFSYAIQWFIFATIGVVGYPLILRNVARRRAVSGDRPPARRQ